MDSQDFDEEEFFRAIGASGARVLLIGRRALVAIGLPVATFDYDFWVHFDDIELLNAAFEKHEHTPNRTPTEARQRGRYVVENGEHIDVMVARAAGSGPSALSFDEAWASRQRVPFNDVIDIQVPSYEHLVRTKLWASRPRDLVDIQLLETLILERDGKVTG